MNRMRMKLLLDGVAITILLGYAWLVWSTASGGSSTAALDPVWAEIQARGSLRVAVDAGFHPFVNEQNGVFSGYDVELAQAIAQKLGVRAEFISVGFDGLYDSLVSGRTDMIASALPYAPEQGFRARFSEFYFDAGQVLVVPAGSAIRSTADLDGLEVGVALGSDAHALAREMAVGDTSLQLQTDYDTPEEALAALRAGQLDAVICDMVSALSATQSKDDLIIAQALSSDPYVLAMPSSAFQLQAEVNQALAQLQREDFFARLNDRWFN